MNNPRIVFDTNVLVSAALFQRSVPRQAFDRAIAIGQVVVSAATLKELEMVLNRPRFDRYVSDATRAAFLEDFRSATERIEITVDFLSPFVFAFGVGLIVYKR